ncbi:1,2-phenylacetyl-CoA epoxidase subunit PaaC [Halosimplex pelagicum]|uniref:Phenylacetate-CoA oxygenase subunit PaaC n=1 Tax=Halosimplex pelagicum TaxID=869886 RepID=A0A7D5TDU4_9EURY|nr:1,2-phenylacetyl-CoA epoxidase subunit PaaC [Halosimplex pelagicum]QLH84153.1 phenylacetate-CoA oxygenase subunit PaaC [Halosimplex pelagicum]
MADLRPLADLDGAERAAAEALLRRLADDEFVLAERYAEWQVVAPTLESDLAVSNVAQDELGHARVWFDALGELGYTEQELVWERDPGDFRHGTLVELPFAEGDWADAVVRGYLYDVGEDLRLDAVAESGVRELVEPVEKIRGEESYHLDHAQTWIERLCADEDGRERVQAATDRLVPHALTLWEPGERAAAIREHGLRGQSLAAMRRQWLDTVGSFLEGHGVTVPLDPGDDPAELLPDAVGRDGIHTDHWPRLHDELTETYRELGRDDVRRLRGESA